MEENQTVPAMIPEGDFAAFLEGEKVETLLSPLGYAYCAEGQDADLRGKRLERLEVTACQRGATLPTTSPSLQMRCLDERCGRRTGVRNARRSEH